MHLIFRPYFRGYCSNFLVDTTLFFDEINLMTMPKVDSTNVSCSIWLMILMKMARMREKVPLDLLIGLEPCCYACACIWACVQFFYIL